MPSPWTEAREGIRDILPAAVAAIPIGGLFGALAVSKGLSPAEVTLMSACVFAGGAQFAAMEIWRTPAPIAVLAFSTLLINLRHVLMGASLAPKTGLFRPWQRFAGFYLLADENWAMAERRAALTRLTPAYYFATIAFFWGNWVLWSTVGAFAGSFMGDPKAWGADFAFSALFIGLIAGFWKSRTALRPRAVRPGSATRLVARIAGFWRGGSTGVTVLASGLAAALAYKLAGPPWHVAAGAVAGIAAAAAAGGGGEVEGDEADPSPQPRRQPEEIAP
ncbi:MAG: AzlC family ABC transporter permease [Alsobacter sp.]